VINVSQNVCERTGNVVFSVVFILDQHAAPCPHLTVAIGTRVQVVHRPGSPPLSSWGPEQGDTKNEARNK